jgi:hypothetical protein
MNGVPIIFIHAGEQHWLHSSMAQARKTNPSSRVVLLAQEVQKQLPADVEFFNLGNYFERAATLKAGYHHFSEYDPAYELFCFQRWFVLHEFMREQGLNRALYLDSDVLLFSDVTKDGEPFTDCDMTLSRGHCGHNSYFNNQDVLARFCDYCAKFLAQEKAAQIRGVLQDVTLQSLGLRETLFPLNDMRVLQLFKENHDFLIGDTALINRQTTFDHDIGTPQGGFEMAEGVKKLAWDGNVPYGTRNGKRIRFATLHFKGPMKPLLEATFAAHGAVNF